MVVTGHLFTILIHGGFIMYEKYLLQLEQAGKIRNLKERSINCYKNYVSLTHYPPNQNLPNRQIQIEQNRCAMACQGCGAVFSNFYKKAVASTS